jgi:hypothetical protein
MVSSMDEMWPRGHTGGDDMTKRRDARDKPETNNVIDRPPDPIGASKPGLGDDHPLNDIIGTHEGPVWERILKNIERNRKRADTEYASD